MSESSATLRIWRDENLRDFDATVATAAEQLGVQPLAVEKDYWVCRALQGIEREYPGAVVFKGGTSLEKLRLVQRFSEDLDLLVVQSVDNKNAGKTLLRKICEAAKNAVEGSLEEEISGGGLGTLHRSAYLVPPLSGVGISAVSAIAEPGRVLIELGQTGGPNPNFRRDVSSLLARQLTSAGIPVSDFSDLEFFSVQILHPGRTLLEKMLRVNNFAVSEEVREKRHGWSRIGRQFYDIYALLGDRDVLDFLVDRGQAYTILQDCYNVSKDFTPDKPIPSGGFAACLAFDPHGAFVERLKSEHDIAIAELYYGLESGPTFDEVLERVQQYADLLDIINPSED
jgi:hypothetical protein